ncbi:MAG: FUSC family membrane protein, partial [Bryobacteraceae bacterium]
MARKTEVSPLAAFWHTVTSIDRSKFNSTWMAFRNALATALPLAVGIAIGNPPGAVAITVGALNVSYSDGRDPYAQRARRMLTWSCLGAFAVFTGSLTGATGWEAVPVAAVWAFVAGMVVSISRRAGDLGLNTLVALIVFGARGALSSKGALIAALLVLAGGLLQTAFALLFWAAKRHAPEREALGSIYTDLAREIDPHSGPPVATPLTATPGTQFQETISALG